jgi:short-subunit dehydrogenase
VTRPERGTALITGASAGIGAAFAHVLAAEGFDLVLVARRVDRLVEIAAEVEERFGVSVNVLGTDLADPSAAAGMEQHLATEGVEVDVLVNNAGFALKDAFMDASWREHAGFIQVMATSVAELCHRFAPGMKQRGFGRIINVSSIAAFAPETAGSLYGAVKLFTLSLSRALAKELDGTGVHVSALCPGYTLTEFHDVIDVREEIDRLPGFMVMDAMTVARQGWDAVERGDVVYVNGRLNRLIVQILRVMPDRALRAIARRSVLRSKR